MIFRTPHPTLVRGLTAALALAIASACSRSDRTTGGQTATTGTAGSVDTQSVASKKPTTTSSVDTTLNGQRSPATSTASENAEPKPTTTAGVHDTSVSGYRAMGHDTASTRAVAEETGQNAANTAQPSQDTVAVGDSSHIGKTGNRLEPTQSSEQANADTLANQPGSDRVRPPEDSSETSGVSSDMARDTNTQLGQTDTTAPAQTDIAAQAAVDSSAAASDTSTEVPADTAAVQVRVDTQQVEMAQQAPADTSALQVQADTSNVEQQTEVAQQPPADTTAIQGEADTAVAEQPTEVAPQVAADSAGQADTAAVASVDSTQLRAPHQAEAVEADSAVAGAASVSTGNTATGAEAVALMSREGRRCSVVDSEEDRDARWDLAFSPATMNPCGTGTMTLPRVQAEEK